MEEQPLFYTIVVATMAMILSTQLALRVMRFLKRRFAAQSADEPKQGNWGVQSYMSGTVNVQSLDPEERRWFWIGYPKIDADTDEKDRVRVRVGADLARWLNDGTKPGWFDQIELVSPTKVRRKSDDLEICACGPVYESEPGRGDWRQDNTEEFLRNELIYVTFLNPPRAFEEPTFDFNPYGDNDEDSDSQT